MKNIQAIGLWFLPLVASGLTYDEWKVTRFNAVELANPAISGPSADPDGDGRLNYGEFALDSNPKVQDLNAAFDVFVDATGKWSVRFLRWKLRPNLLYIPQISSVLNGFWMSGPTHLEEVSVTDRDTQSEWVTSRDLTPMSLLSSRFIRLYIGSDLDGDGLPDDWELHNGLDMFNPYDANSDIDEDGFTAAEEFANGTDPLAKSTPPPSQTPPAAPTNFHSYTFVDGSRFFWWDDNSNNEDYFVIRDTLPDGRIVELGRVGPGCTSFFLPAAQ